MNDKKIVIILLMFIIGISINLFLPRIKAYDEYSTTDVFYLLQHMLIKLKLETSEIFPNQILSTEVTVKMNQSYSANSFNVTIELPSNFSLVNDVYTHSNPPINETTNYEWMTTWIVNSSNVLNGGYSINATENLLNQKVSENLTVNSGPTIPYDVNATTDKSSYSFGESGSIFAYILDSNGYPFNVEGKCNSTIYYPNKTSTSFKNVLMSYVVGSKGEYISSSGFQAWNVEGTYTVEVNCTKPDGYNNNTFIVSQVMITTVPVTTESPQPPSSGPSQGPGPSPVQPSVKVVNFTTDVDLIKILLTPGKTDKKSIKFSNTGKTKLDVTGKIQYLDQLSFFKEGGIEYKFELNSIETKGIEINFLAKSNQEPGVYPGKIVFTSDGIERTVLVVVEVESEKPLFDVKVETLPEYRMVYPGNKVMAQLTIYNLGKIGRVDVNVEYGIKNLSGNIIASENETMAVETQLSTVKTLNIPSALKPDNYVFFGKVSYKDVVGTGSDMFQVLEKVKVVLPITYIMLVIFAFVILSLILIIYTLKKRKPNKKIIHKKRKK
jgi:hypothetical protein